MSDRYDAGLLNDWGGGNVEWWQDYIRAELGRAEDFYATRIAELEAQLAEVQALRREIEVTNACNDGLGRLNDVVRKRAEVAEAEVARLREALQWQADQPEAQPFMSARARAAIAAHKEGEA